MTVTNTSRYHHDQISLIRFCPEAFANKHNVWESALDGIGIGLGFTMSLTIIGIVREILGSGSVFGWKFIAGDGILAFVMAPGAFMVLGYLLVLFNKIAKK